MTNLELLLGLILLTVMLLTSTANVSLQQLSRVGLVERLEPRGRIEWVNQLIASRDELVFSFSFLRLSSILGMAMLIDHLFGHERGQTARELVHYVSVFVLSLAAAMIAGVAVPNAWARYGGDAFLAAGLPVLLGLRKVLYPLITLQRASDAVIRRLAGIPRPDDRQEEADQIEKEILGAVSEGELAGTVHEDQADMIESIMEFRDISVSQIMTPRTDIVALPLEANLDQARELIGTSGHSRIPVYSGNIDDIRGVLYAKDLLLLAHGQAFDSTAILRKVPFVPEAKRISDLLSELRVKKVHLAIVLDEYGGVSGLVTIEDILEELVGEISDEYEETEPDPMTRIDERTLEVDARVRIDEVNEELGITIPDGDDYDTIGGFVFSTLGKIPAAGEQLTWGNVCLKVIAAEEKKINRLRLEVVGEAEDS